MPIRRLLGLFLLGSSVSSVLAQGPRSIDPTFGKAIPRPVVESKRATDASWIWSGRVGDDQTIYLRRSLLLKTVPSKASIFVAADNQFVLYVNGQKVATTPVDPGDPNLWQRVQAVDVTSLLKPGENSIAVQARNDSSAAGVVVRLEGDGKPLLLSDESWKVSESLPGGEWTQSGFTDGGWAAAKVEYRVGLGPWGDALKGWPVELNGIPNYLFHLPLRPTRWAYAGDPDRLEWHNTDGTVKIPRPSGAGDWRVVFDFGKELTGRVLTDGSTPGLTVGTGESTGEVLNMPWTSGQGTASPYTALRYATVTMPAGVGVANLNVRFDHLYYPVKYQGSFDCSDPLLTRAWYTGAYTTHLCMQQEIWDAPKRDRQRWMGDLQVSGEVINDVFADQFLMERTMRMLREDAQGGRPDSELPGGHVNGIPGYSYSWVVGLADLYRHLGDKEYLEAQHDALVSLLQYCRQDLDEHGAFVNKQGGWLFTDWTPGFTEDSPMTRATAHLFLFKAVSEAVFLFREMGDKENAAKCAEWAKELKLSAQSGLVVDGTFGIRPQENAMAIFSGVATQAQADKMFATGVFKPEAGPTDLLISPYYGNYVLQAMAEAGHTQDGLDYLRREWGQMIKDGATTFYESYDPFWDKHNFHAHLQWDKFNTKPGSKEADAAGYHTSLCHGWSAGPTTFLTEFVLGVRSTGAGFKTCLIAPKLGDLGWASGVVPTPFGGLKLRVDRRGSGVSLKLDVPKGVLARVDLGGGGLVLDGKKVFSAEVEVGEGGHTVFRGL